MLRLIKSLLYALIIVISPFSHSTPLPAPLTSALILKVVQYNKQIGEKESITIQVINDDAVAERLSKSIGAQVANAKIVKVIADQVSLSDEADIIFLGRVKDVSAIIDQAAKKQTLSITSYNDQLEQGVVLSLFDNDGVPGILLNIGASKKQNLQWDTEILNFASAINQ